MEIYKFVFSPIEVNTYVLADKSGDCAIIDCGCYNSTETEKLAGFIKAKNLNPVLVLNTHCHLDHIFGNSYLLEKYKLKPLSCELDEANRLEPAGFIADNQIVTFGTTDLLALQVPGHTLGSLAFYSEKNDCVFTGDALFAGSIGRTDLPGGNYDTLINSIRNKLFVLPGSTIVYPGHGKETTIEKEIKTNPFF